MTSIQDYEEVMTYKEALEKYQYCLSKNLLNYFEDNSEDIHIDSNQFNVHLYFTKNRIENTTVENVISSTIEFYDIRSIEYPKLYRVDWFFDSYNNLINCSIFTNSNKTIKQADIDNLIEEYENIEETGMVLKYGREVPDSSDIDILYQIIKEL